MSAKSLRYIPRSMESVAHYRYVWFGWVWLKVFFVRSSFLITSILSKEKNRRLGNYLDRFCWRRLLRTFPAYLGYLPVCWLVYIFLKQPTGYPNAFPFLATYCYNLNFLLDRSPFQH